MCEGHVEADRFLSYSPLWLVFLFLLDCLARSANLSIQLSTATIWHKRTWKRDLPPPSTHAWTWLTRSEEMRPLEAAQLQRKTKLGKPEHRNVISLRVFVVCSSFAGQNTLLRLGWHDISRHFQIFLDISKYFRISRNFPAETSESFFWMEISQPWSNWAERIFFKFQNKPT